MNLFINTPNYYTSEYGIDDEVYRLCNFISRNIDIRKYTKAIDTIGIVPIIAPKEFVDDVELKRPKEIKRINLNLRMAHISLQIDYDSYLKAGIAEKQKMIVDNIIASMKVIKRKLKDEFDYDGIAEEIITLYETEDKTIYVP